MKPKNNKDLATRLPIPTGLIERQIYLIRGREVMLDSDLAELYQVPTKRLNEAVRRNISRFPGDFMFRLTAVETKFLRSQFATLKTGRGQYSKYAAHAFSEHGIVMLSSVLNSQRAIAMNIFIVRAFIELRKTLLTHQELAKRPKKVEGIQRFHGQVLSGVVKDIQKIKNPPKTNAIGFEWKSKTKMEITNK